MDGETVGRWILEVGHRLFEEAAYFRFCGWHMVEEPFNS